MIGRRPFPPPSFAHLRRLTDIGGLHEHARGTTPRLEHGYCVDDVARALAVVSRERGPECDDLRAQYLAFVLAAQDGDGRFRNRRSPDLRWRGAPRVDDCWGRALWGLAAAAADPRTPDPDRAVAAFDRGAQWRSPWPRAMSYAALGAAQMLELRPGHADALEILHATAAMIGSDVPRQDDWPWPEPRLTYANAVLPEALLAAGAGLENSRLVDDGLLLLGWLLAVQTRAGLISVVPVGGRDPADEGPGFDQQPIEVAVLADACVRAYAFTGDTQWRDGIERAVAWFLGANDVATVMYDRDSGGGFDGLHHDGRNENQGAESTLALISTLQQVRDLPGMGRSTASRPVAASLGAG